jgi:sugar phosphate isomerase/epimerase
MKISVTMISFADYAGKGKMDVSEFIDICAGYGIDGVDILEYYWKDKESEVKALPGLLKEHGLEIGSFCIGNNFIVPDKDRVAQYEKVKDGIRTAVELGASRLRIFGGPREIPADVQKGDRISIIVEGILKVIDYAKANSVTLILENHGGIPVTSNEMLQVLRGVNSPFLKVNFDIGNFLYSGNQDPLAAAADLSPYVEHIHAKDFKIADKPGNQASYEFCITGEGIVPVKECLKFFKSKGYQGYVVLEYEAWDTCDSKAGVKKSVEYLKKVLDEI